MRFEFATATRVVFGPGALSDVGSAAREFGLHALIVTGRNPQRAGRLIELLVRAGISATSFPITGEPTVDDATRGAAGARAAGCDFVIGFGGGAALDAAKA